MIELLVGADDGLNFRVGVDLDGIEGGNIHGIGHGEGQEEFGLQQGSGLKFLGEFQGNHLGELDVDGVVIRVVFSDFELLRDNISRLRSTDDALSVPGIVPVSYWYAYGR